MSVEDIRRKLEERVDAGLVDPDAPAVPDNDNEPIAADASPSKPSFEAVLPPPDKMSEDRLALAFASRMQDELRYVAPWGQWFRYDGTRWCPDDTLAVFDGVRGLCRTVASFMEEANRSDVIRRLESASYIAAVERLARSDRRLAATTDQWDADPDMLNTPGGVVDLRTAQIRPHDRRDYQIKQTSVTPDLEPAPDGSTSCPKWHRFLHQITGGDQELISYLQRLAGYALTGRISEHMLAFLWGKGGNGKGTFLSVLQAIMGDYAEVAAVEAFIASGGTSHPADLAKLHGARLVTAQETEKGAKWAESRIKSITGGDTITARFMRQNYFDFKPQFTLVMAGNHKPRIENLDQAMRRRLHLVPFTVEIPTNQQIPDLDRQLEREHAAILGWAVQGAAQWYEAGLRPPQAVMQASEAYFSNEDVFGEWLAEKVKDDPNHDETSQALYADWKAWAEARGERVGTNREFKDQMAERGYPAQRLPNGPNRGRIGFTGVMLAPSTTLGD